MQIVANKKVRAFWEVAKFKNLAVFVNTQKPLVKPLLAMFYIHC